MESFSMEPQADVGSADPAVRQQFSTPFATGSRHTATTSKVCELPPQGANATGFSDDTECHELEKVIKPVRPGTYKSKKANGWGITYIRRKGWNCLKDGKHMDPVDAP